MRAGDVVQVEVGGEKQTAIAVAPADEKGQAWGFHVLSANHYADVSEFPAKKSGGDSAPEKASDSMTHSELDKLASDRKVSDADYPASGNKKEKAAAINAAAKGNG